MRSSLQRCRLSSAGENYASTVLRYNHAKRTLFREINLQVIPMNQITGWVVSNRLKEALQNAVARVLGDAVEAVGASDQADWVRSTERVSIQIPGT